MPGKNNISIFFPWKENTAWEAYWSTESRRIYVATRSTTYATKMKVKEMLMGKEVLASYLLHYLQITRDGGRKIQI